MMTPIWGNACKLSLGVAVVAALVTGGAGDASAQSVLGVWWAPKKDSKIEISQDGNGIVTGRVIAIVPQNQDTRDARNPDASLRSRRILGVTIVSGFVRKADGTFGGGKIYDPESGSTYDATMRLADLNHLVLRGYIGLSLFGRDQTFERVLGPDPKSQQTLEPVLVYLAQ